MTDRPLRWGIASTGGIAASMTQALQTLDGPTGAEVVAVGSRSPDSAEEFAARFDIPHAHGSYADLYADPDVDIVYVASPHSHHHEMTIDAPQRASTCCARRRSRSTQHSRGRWLRSPVSTIAS